jgi:hypothetical protein
MSQEQAIHFANWRCKEAALTKRKEQQGEEMGLVNCSGFCCSSAAGSVPKDLIDFTILF